ncbi:restriction endonuclease [Pedobacter nyackensis]|uniref:nSTAND3 domain-containing NTPase n=1 Tax=Pedobacter nyackensis TaxID=475255 RepID=UPI00292D6CD0|nr:restriction endonuclease [Pedobacter nyackensis]
MPNYNYHVLSPTEFENLVRDLIQRQEKITLESFKEGKDSGIDLRYAKAKRKSIIVQAKRYKDDYDVLYKKLEKEELPKVKKLKPGRYILVTSVGLTPNNKTAILNLFGGFIKSTANVIGKDDIDNLLGLYPDLEKAHIKLWLTSTNIMQEVLNSKEYNQSRFELETINDEIRFYVQNDSFERAQNIISKEKFVVISGIPGIGKTTLARMLAFRYLADGYEEFIYISGNIDDALTLYSPEKKQVFFYDDFLGENFLSDKLSKNEDKRILAFINKIKRESNKILIMTTREYILRQAETTYPLMEELKSAKATLELSDYTPLIKAQILFNHLFFNNINPDYLENIIDDSNYFKIIGHKNYSPRIIAAIAKDKIWDKVGPSDFTTEILSFLDNPFKIWENVFNTKISQLSQTILLVLSISGVPMLIDDLKYSVEANRSFSGPEFKLAIKELENTFILTNADKNGVIAVEFQNNSILDYLLNYLKTNRSELLKLLNNIRFISQGFTMFSFPKREAESGVRLIQEFTPIDHDDATITSFKNVLSEKLEELFSSCKIFKSSLLDDNFKWNKIDDNRFEWLARTFELFDLEKDEKYRSKLISIISAIDPYELKIDREFTPILHLRYQLGDYLETDVPKFIKAAGNNIEDFDALGRFCQIGDPYRSEFIDYVKSPEGKELKEKALEWCQIEFAKGLSPTFNPPPTDYFTRIFYKAEMERICEEINYISDRLGLGVNLDSEYHKEYVRYKLKQNAKVEDSTADNEAQEVAAVIKDLFKSLKH